MLLGRQRDVNDAGALLLVWLVFSLAGSSSMSFRPPPIEKKKKKK
jgi:hypothetical protein